MTEPKIKMPKKSIKERQEQVLEVLIGLLNSEDGMQRVTTERLAQAVGVSEGALYRYFPSKSKMFEALIERIEFARKNPGVTRILTGHALMFEDQLLKARITKFFDGLELQLTNILQMRKLEPGRRFEDERLLAGYLVSYCEGQFLRLIRSNFTSNQHQNFEKQWSMIRPLFD